MRKFLFFYKFYLFFENLELFTIEKFRKSGIWNGELEVLLKGDVVLLFLRDAEFLLQKDFAFAERDFAHCGERPYFGPPQNMEKTLHSCVGIFEIPTRAVVALFWGSTED